jgi:hypothetical protein
MAANKNAKPIIGKFGGADLLPMLTGLYLLPKRVIRVFEDYDKGIKRDDAITTVRSRFDEAMRAGAANFVEIHKVSLYVLLFDEDLCAYTQDYYLANTHRRHRFVARHLASLLYEGSQDLPALLGRTYRASLRAVEPLGDWEAGLNAIRGGFNGFKRDNEAALKAIRDVVGAHKDKDVARQLRTLDRIDPMTIYSLAADFAGPMRELVAFQIAITAHLSNPRVMLREVASHLNDR